MNSDSQYLIGHSHHVCEDYALSGFYEKMYYAIIADGCSSSQDVDIGARVLAKSAEGVIRSVYEHHYQPHYYWDIVGKMIVSNAQKTIRSLGVPDTALDSTLLFIVGYENSPIVNMFAYGDGVFSYYDFDDKLHVIDIEYESGAPYYLSYLLDKQRQEGYHQQFSGDVLITHYIENHIGELETYNRMNEYVGFELCFSAQPKGYISALSDGVKTFHGLDFPNVMKDFMGFKNSQGEFVKRRMNALKRRYDRDGLKHDDDISMASIFIG
jgi:hypothetical protein